MQQEDARHEMDAPSSALIEPSLAQDDSSVGGIPLIDNERRNPVAAGQRPRITVGSAPHLGGYVPRKRLIASPIDRGSAGAARNQAQQDPESTEDESVEDRGQASSDLSELGNAGHHPAPRVIIESEEALNALPESDIEVTRESGMEVQGPMTVLDYYLGTSPQAVILLLHPDAARAIEEYVEASGEGVLHAWPVNGEGTLVAYSRLANHWEAITSVSRIKVLQRPRRRFLTLITRPFGFSLAGLACAT
ncbi:hypothetical protein NMY22_g6956 [Coprinellus aureogranulatus]|nr:hypothetical protein NMY22_g6956 [Coprinellus aureogranulatus]